MNCDNGKNGSNIPEFAGGEEINADENPRDPSSIAVKHIRCQSTSTNNAVIASIIDR